MSLDDRYVDLRDAINGCIGYRILDDGDVLQVGDETACGSTFLAGNEEFSFMLDDDFHDLFGMTVEMDVRERMFRRKITL